jgi:hypothetical protein
MPTAIWKGTSWLLRNITSYHHISRLRLIASAPATCTLKYYPMDVNAMEHKKETIEVLAGGSVM